MAGTSVDVSNITAIPYLLLLHLTLFVALSRTMNGELVTEAVEKFFALIHPTLFLTSVDERITYV